MTTIQKVYGKGRYDGIMIGIMIALTTFIVINYFNKKGENQYA